MDEANVGPAHRRFRVAAWAMGNACGVLTVAPRTLTFDPGLLARTVNRLSGELVHTANAVVVTTSLLAWTPNILGLGTTDAGLVMKPLLTKRSPSHS